MLMLPSRAIDVVAVFPEIAETESWSVLDGRVFKGEIGVDGKPALRSDTWIFDNGQFVSRSCVECGFGASPYWVRFENDRTTFRTETHCPVTDATLVWRGSVKDGVIEGVFTWTKKRWYRTIEKDFWFKGVLVDDPQRDVTGAY
jgi:hypothetical protein